MAFNGDLIVVCPYFWYDIARMKSMEYYNVTNVLNIKFKNMNPPIFRAYELSAIKIIILFILRTNDTFRNFHHFHWRILIEGFRLNFYQRAILNTLSTSYFENVQFHFSTAITDSKLIIGMIIHTSWIHTSDTCGKTWMLRYWLNDIFFHIPRYPTVSLEWNNDTIMALHLDENIERFCESNIILG